MNLNDRPRRLRISPAMRAMVSETQVPISSLILPLFVVQGSGLRVPSSHLPDVDILSTDLAVRRAQQAWDAGIKSLLLFGSSPAALKDNAGVAACDPNGVIPTAVRAIKAACPDIVVMTDIALDPYSSFGHDGIVVNNTVDNDSTVEVLARMSLVHADAGADVVAPSDMMDGRVAAIRSALDLAGHKHVLIMSYAAKYASCLYGPFRSLLDSGVAFGDKKTYQMNPANRREARRELRSDVFECADIVMVKPGSWYSDIISDARAMCDIPVAAYQVSGEYAMLHLAAAAGHFNLLEALHESLLCLRRAGADLIATYGAMRMATDGQHS